MKKILTIAVISLLFCACQKDSGSDPQTQKTVTTLKLTVNGIKYEMNGSLADNSRQGSIFTKSSDKYYLDAYDSTSSLSLISFGVPTLSLAVKSYGSTYPDLAAYGEFSLSNSMYTYHCAGDNMTITITNIHDGVYADGTFSGQITKDRLNTPNVTITNGEFKNVKILL